MLFTFTAVGEEIWKSDEAQAYPINAGEEKPMYTGTYTIARLRPATVYMARVSSQNNYGYSHPSQVFKFATRGAGKNNIITYFNELSLFYIIYYINHLSYSHNFLSILDPVQRGQLSGNGGGAAPMTTALLLIPTIALLFLL